ncbi:MAG: PEP-CTERM sorting domain-containing protein [Thermoguttaceae bacterium]|jgi:hypothetical protein
MKPLRHLSLAAALAALPLISNVVHADIPGFEDLSGFTVNQTDSGSPPTYSNGVLQLTNGYVDENRSIFYDTPQGITQFSASFTFTATGPWNGTGASFVLQTSPSGASAAGNGTDGYGAFPGASVAIVLDSYQAATGFFTDANIGNGLLPVSPVNLFSGHPIDLDISYSDSLLHESLLDTTNGASFDTSYLVLTPLPTILGGSTAYVGISASADNNGFFSGPGVQSFSNFQFVSSVPEPSTIVLLGVASLSMLAFAWRSIRANHVACR